MSEELQLALNLMVIGMATVFVILLLVVLGGKMLIFWANKYHPQSAVIQVLGRERRASSKLAAIVAVVEIITGGRGKVESIRRTDN